MLRFIAVAFIAAFAIANLGNALYKGGDFTVLLEAGDRFLNAAPLYEGSGPGAGVTWPPAQAVAFAPLAALARFNLPGARLCWYLISLAALAIGIWAWTMAFWKNGWPDVSSIDRSAVVAWALLAITLPLQTNFEHQNMNTVLLALTGLATYACVTGRDAAGGALVGVATAVKAVPGLLILYLVCVRRWRAAAVAIATAGLLNALPAIVYGPKGAWDTFRQWMVLSDSGGWPTRSQNQSVFAMIARSAPSHAEVIAAAIAVSVIAVLIVIAVSTRRTDATLTAELALTLSCAVLLSPIAWNHYWVLMFPALVAVYMTGATDRISRTVFWIAAILMTGLSPITLGTHRFNIVRTWSPDTIAGLLLVVMLVRSLARSMPRAAASALKTRSRD